jgi:MFS family permease
LTVTETQDGARRWPRIWAVFLTGVAAAFLVGKAPAALPVLRDELELSLFQAGLVVSMFSLVAAITGCFFGALSDRFGQLRLAIIGLVAASAAGAWGSLVHSGEWLIVTRVAEGIGFFMMSVSLPGLIIRLADERTRQTAMGLWGAYLPLGAGLVLLAGGVVISTLGWRGLWLAISATYVLCLAALVWAAPCTPADEQSCRRRAHCKRAENAGRRHAGRGVWLLFRSVHGCHQLRAADPGGARRLGAGTCGCSRCCGHGRQYRRQRGLGLPA